MGPVTGRDRQEMGEDGGLFAVGQIRNDEVIAGERLQFEDVGADRNVGNEWSFVGVKISGADSEPKRAEGINHVAAARAWLKDQALDFDRAAERRDNPVCIEGEVAVAFEALKAGRRDVTMTAGLRSWRRP